MSKKKVERLLVSVSEGDEEAFEELYMCTRRGVFAFLYAYMHNYHDAEDLMQSVYLKIKMNISSYTQNGSGLAWILQIAKNLALNELSKKKRQIDAEDRDIADDTPFEYGAVADIMYRCLSEDEQRIIILHVIYGYKHREIGKILGIPLGTVTSKYKRAIEKLKAEIRRCDK